MSRSKFEREVQEFRSLAEQHLQRGWVLVHADFPRARFLMTATQTIPPTVVVGVMLDYANYDAAPPSVTLVHPYTGTPFKFKELPTPLNRSMPPQQLALPAAAPGQDGANAQQQFVIQAQAQQPLMQAHSPEDVPFLCLAGVREYHEHPAHSGDLWELHRPAGAGRMVRLLDIISKYGTDTIKALKVELAPRVTFGFGAPPQ